jgi:HK97 gp10 family phage protein
VEMAVAKTALDVEREAKHSMEGPKHGRTYVRGSRVHVASAPGEAPAIDYGNLHNATRAIRKGRTEWWVVPDTEYAATLEFGTRKMAPRPFLGAAVEQCADSFYQAMTFALKVGG